MCPRPDTARSDPKDIGELANPLRDRIYTMLYDAPTKGLVLVSGYRDPGRQWDLRHERVPHGQECNPAYRGNPLTAVPARLVDGQWVGGSKHQHRQAADIGGREMRWARENCHRYGLAQTVRSEDWHYEARGEPTVRILRYPGPTYDHTPPEEFTMDQEAKDAFKALNKRLESVESKTDRLLADATEKTKASGAIRKALGRIESALKT